MPKRGMRSQRDRVAGDCRAGSALINTAFKATRDDKRKHAGRKLAREMTTSNGLQWPVGAGAGDT